MTVEVKGNQLIITTEIDQHPGASKSGKTLVVASSHGNQPTSAIVQGQPVIIGFNAYIRKG